MKSYLLGIGIPAVLAFIIFLGKTYFKDILNAAFKRIRRNYSWNPGQPLRNPHETKHISTYPRDYKMDWKEKTIAGFVEGEAAFIQYLIKFVLTERYKYKIYSNEYGVEQSTTIFYEKNVKEFVRQCEHLASRIMSYSNLSDWIECIYGIHRKRNKLFIELKVKGKPDTLICEIPNLNETKHEVST